ncbi:MAG: polysaccharide deacetylase family protein [Arenibacterium sp.]
MNPTKGFLSIDFEDFAHDLKRDLGLWETGPLRGDALWQCYEDIDTFLTRQGVRATFFTTGIIASQLPDLVARMAQDGHEVACHYYFHDELRRQSLETVETNLRRAKRALQDASGQEVLGFRAPKFRIEKSTPDQYRAVERHFTYDSSLCVATPQDVSKFSRLMGLRTLKLLPIFSTAPLPGLPALKLGGSYMKLFPMTMTRRMVSLCRQAGKVAHVYLHPYEFATKGQFRLSASERAPLGGPKSRYWGLRQHQWHTIGNRSLAGRLQSLFSETGLGGRLCDHLDQLDMATPTTS